MDDFVAGMNEADHSRLQDVALAVDDVFENSLDHVEDLQGTVSMGHRFGSRLEHHLADFNVFRPEIALIKQEAEDSASWMNIRVTGVPPTGTARVG